ncbi:MAG: patatin-like phospholipase family protein [Nitrospira sp.]
MASEDKKAETNEKPGTEADVMPGEPGPEIANPMPNAQMPIALVMKGGGVKGLAYVGAIKELIEHGYAFDWYVGTSAGAIAAVLLAAGYTVEELENLLTAKNFQDFFDASWLQCCINLVSYRGCYPAQTLIDWIDTLLANKLNKATRVKLSDLPARATVYASQREKRALCFDSQENDVAAAYAVRCSMSIPIIFTPASDQGVRAYDGGLQNNYPVEELLRTHPGTRFISLYLGHKTYEPIRQRSVIGDLISIWTESHDGEALDRHKNQTVIIDVRPIGTLDFALTEDEKRYLIVCGKAAALGFIRRSEDALLAAEQELRELKAKVEGVRAQEKAQKRSRRRRRGIWITMFLVVCISALLGYWWFFTGMKSFPGSCKDYLDLRDESGEADSTGRSSFFKENAPRKVHWRGYVVDKTTHGYIVHPNETDERDVLVLVGGDYVPTIPLKKYIIFTGIVIGDAPSGLLSVRTEGEPHMVMSR